MYSIPFFESTLTGNEQQYVNDVLQNPVHFTKRTYAQLCTNKLRQIVQSDNAFLTKSCTQSLELAALLIGIEKGDEVILPSFAYVACANAFVLRGATCVFVDIEASTMNIDASKIEAAITPKTKAIVTINYSGIGCDADIIDDIARKHGIYWIEDNAHGIFGSYKNRPLGSLGDVGVLSFDHLKMIQCGQGGGIVINRPELLENFAIHYEQGTNRIQFMQGKAPNYEWKNVGSNYILSELNTAVLWTQLEVGKDVIEQFKNNWSLYNTLLKPLVETGKLRLPVIPENRVINGYNYYIKTEHPSVRKPLIDFLSLKGITAQFHFVPLHESTFGKQNGRVSGSLQNTEFESACLIRLPHFYKMRESDIHYVAESLLSFFETEL